MEPATPRWRRYRHWPCRETQPYRCGAGDNGRSSPWNQVYQLMRCPGAPCVNGKWYWQYSIAPTGKCISNSEIIARDTRRHSRGNLSAGGLWHVRLRVCQCHPLARQSSQALMIVAPKPVPPKPRARALSVSDIATA